MDQLIFPTKIDYTPGSKPNETIVSIEPLYPGYGLTIGTALRRVLLSSLPGGAVVAVKIKGVQHEFSTLPYVKEDVVDILLNIKRLRFNVHSTETVKLVLHAKGEKEVTGADIEPSTEAEVANPESSICNLTSKSGQLEIELFVKKGRGYLPTEGREKEGKEIGVIALDALFTPIRNVGLHVDDVRVGQMTNYNKIVLTVETDGSLTAQEAVEQAAKILVDHFAFCLPAGSASREAGADDQEDLNEVLSSGDSDEDDNGDKEPKKRGRPRKNA